MVALLAAQLVYLLVLMLAVSLATDMVVPTVGRRVLHSVDMWVYLMEL